MEFGVGRRGGGPKTLILIDEQVEALADGLSMLRGAMYIGEISVIGRMCESDAFRLDVRSQSPYGSSIRRFLVHVPISARN